MQQLLPVGRDAWGGSWRRLIQWVMVRRCELGAVVVELLVAIVVEPMFFRLVTGDPGMSGRVGVPGGVLAGGGETTIRAVVHIPRSPRRWVGQSCRCPDSPSPIP